MSQSTQEAMCAKSVESDDGQLVEIVSQRPVAGQPKDGSDNQGGGLRFGEYQRASGGIENGSVPVAGHPVEGSVGIPPDRPDVKKRNRDFGFMAVRDMRCERPQQRPVDDHG